ncbi:MAG: hypothetical protein ABMB14_23345, partial [Myxococcota bacterium]
MGELRIDAIDAPAVTPDRTDPGPPLGALWVSPALADALAAQGRGTASAVIPPDAVRATPLTPEEKLLRAIFGEIASGIHVAPVGAVVRWDRLIHAPAAAVDVRFWPAPVGQVVASALTVDADGSTRAEVALSWTHPAELGDRVVDATAATLRITGLLGPDGALRFDRPAPR